MPKVFAELEEVRGRLERHFRDMQDFEFTIEDGRLFMLQTRNGKRLMPGCCAYCCRDESGASDDSENGTPENSSREHRFPARLSLRC